MSHIHLPVAFPHDICVRFLAHRQGLWIRCSFWIAVGNLVRGKQRYACRISFLRCLCLILFAVITYPLDLDITPEA